MTFANLDGVTLSKECPKIITPITPRTLEDLEKQALELGGQKLEDYKGRELAWDTNDQEGSAPTFISDIVEWRIDCYDYALDPGAITHAAAILRARTPLPILAPFRTTPGGPLPGYRSDAFPLHSLPYGKGASHAVLIAE